MIFDILILHDFETMKFKTIHNMLLFFFFLKFISDYPLVNPCFPYLLVLKMKILWAHPSTTTFVSIEYSMIYLPMVSPIYLHVNACPKKSSQTTISQYIPIHTFYAYKDWIRPRYWWGLTYMDLPWLVIWLVVWNITFIFPFSWEWKNHHNWQTLIFFRGVLSTTNQ